MNQNDSIYHLVTDSSHLNGGDRTCPECRGCGIHRLIRRRDCLYRVDSLDHAKDLQTQMRRRPINLGLFSFLLYEKGEKNEHFIECFKTIRET